MNSPPDLQERSARPHGCCGPFTIKQRRLAELVELIEQVGGAAQEIDLDSALAEKRRIEGWLAAHRHVSPPVV